MYEDQTRVERMFPFQNSTGIDAYNRVGRVQRIFLNLSYRLLSSATNHRHSAALRDIHAAMIGQNSSLGIAAEYLSLSQLLGFLDFPWGSGG